MQRIAAFILSLLLLLSSSGITYAQHYCGDFKMMEQLTIGKKHLSCGMVMENSSCGDEHAEDHDCCDNKYTSVTTDDNFAMSSFDIVFQDNFTAALITVFVLEHPTRIKEASPAFLDYNPPPLLKDIPILYETFLI